MSLKPYYPGDVQPKGRALELEMRAFLNSIKTLQYNDMNKKLKMQNQIRYGSKVYEFFADITANVEKGLYSDANGADLLKNLLLIQSGRSADSDEITSLSNMDDERFNILKSHFLNNNQDRIKEVAYDYEFLSRKNADNIVENMGVWQYTFLTADDLSVPVEQRTYSKKSNIIGWHENDDMAKEVQNIIYKLKSGKINLLNDQERVTFDFMSRFGASVDNLSMDASGRIILPSLVKDEAKGYQTVENLTHAYDLMLQAGKMQEQFDVYDNMGSLVIRGGYNQYAKDMADSLLDFSGDYDYVIASAYNGKRAEEVVNSTMLRLHPEIREAMHGYINGKPTAKLINFDPLELLNADKLRKSGFIDSRGITASKTESVASEARLWANLFGDILEEEAHHNTDVDTMQLSQISHHKDFIEKNLKPAFEIETKLRSNRSAQGLSSSGQLYMQFSDIAPFLQDSVLSMTYDKYGIDALGAGVTNVHFNNGTTVGYDLKNKGSVSYTAENNLYANAPVQKNAIYKIDLQHIRHLQSNDPIAMNARQGMGDAGKNARGFVVFQMENVNGMTSHVVMPENMFSAVMAKQNLLGIMDGDDWQEAYGGKLLQKNGYYIASDGNKVSLNSVELPEYLKTMEKLKLDNQLNERIIRGSGVTSIGRATALKNVQLALENQGIINKGSHDFRRAFLRAVNYGEKADVMALQNYLSALPKGMQYFTEGWRYGFGLKQENLSLYDAASWIAPYRSQSNKSAGYLPVHARQEVFLQQKLLNNSFTGNSFWENFAEKMIEAAPDDYAKRNLASEIAVNKLIGQFDGEELKGILGNGVTGIRKNSSVTLNAYNFLKGSQGKGDSPILRTTMTFDSDNASHQIWNQIVSDAGYDPTKIKSDTEKNIWARWTKSLVSENSNEGGFLHEYQGYLKDRYDVGADLTNLYNELQELLTPKDGEFDYGSRAKLIINKLRQIKLARMNSGNAANLGDDLSSPINLISGTGFNEASSTFTDADRKIESAIEKGIQSPGAAVPISEDTQIANILGATGDNRNSYRKNIKGIGNKREKILKAFYSEQEAGVKAFTKILKNSIEKSGGRLFIGEGNQIWVSYGPRNGFAASRKNITSLLPKLEVNGSVLQYRIGDVAYAADGLLTFESGKLKYQTRIASILNSIKGISGKVAERRFLNADDIAASVTNMISVAASDMRTDPVKDGYMREMRNNAAALLQNIYKDADSRNALRTYLGDYEFATGPNSRYVNEFLTELNAFENSYSPEKRFYTSQGLETAFTRLMQVGIINPEIQIGVDKMMTNAALGSNLSQKKVGAAGYLSFVDYESGGSALDDSGRGINYIKEHYLNFNSEILKSNKSFIGRDFGLYESNGIKRRQVGLVTAEENAAKNALNDIETVQNLSFANWEAKTKDIDEFLQEVESKYGAAETKRLEALLGTHEGGAFISGRIADAVGLASGSKKTAIDYKEVIDEDLNRTNIVFKNGKIQYSEGYVVKRGQELFKTHSTYDNAISGQRAQHVSRVTQRLFTKGGVELTEAQAVHQIHVATVNELMRNASKTGTVAKDATVIEAEANRKMLDVNYMQEMASKLFTRKMVSENLEAIQNTKMMISLEKHEAQVGIDAFKTMKNINKGIYNFLHENKYMQGLAEFMGYSNVDDLKLGTSLYKDIASLSFSNPIWNILGLTGDVRKDFIAQALKATGAYNGDEHKAWSSAIAGSRYYSSDILRKLTGAESVSYNLKDIEKHGSISESIADTYNELINKAVSKSMSFEAATKDAAASMSQFFVTDKGGKIALKNDKYGNLIMPSAAETGAWQFMHKAFDEYRNKLGIGIHGADGSRIIKMVSGAFADDAVDFSSKVLMDNRELNSLANETYTTKGLEYLKSKFSDSELAVFKGILDEKGNIKKEYRNASVWDVSTVKSIIGKNFFAFQDASGLEAGEHVLTPEKINSLSKSEREAYDALRKELGDSATISEEIVKKIDYWRSGNQARELYDLSKNGDLSLAANIEKYGFATINASDVHTDLKNGRAYAKDVIEGRVHDGRWIWNKNMAVDLADGDDEFRKILQSEGIESRMFVGHGDFIENRFVVGGESVPLAGYQNTAKSIIDDIKDLREYQRSIDNGFTSDGIKTGRTRIISRIKAKQAEYEESMKNFFSKHNGGGLAEEMNKRRITMGANRTKTVVYDVNSLNKNAVKHVSELQEFKYNGRSLASHYAEGNNISFVIASTEDLEKYGYNKTYFENLAKTAGYKNAEEAKSAWLARAKTEGVAGFVNRSPSDYFHSTGTTRLYFSDNQNAGVVKADSITAQLMKNDADGDTILSMMIGSRTNKGLFIDLNTYENMLERNGAESDREAALAKVRAIIGSSAVDDLENMRIKHHQGMLMKLYENAEMYKNTGISYEDSYYNAASAKGLAEVSEERIAYLSKHALLRNNNSVIQSHARSFLTKNEADIARASWEEASASIRSISAEVGIGKMPAADEWANIYELGNKFLNDSIYSGFMTEKASQQIRKGLEAYDRLMEPVLENILKGNQEHVGEIDNPLFVMDKLNVAYRNKFGFTDEMAENYKATQKWREMTKEGFLSSKSTDPEKAGSFAKSFKQNMEYFIKSNGSDEKAYNTLVDLSGEFGKYSALKRFGGNAKEVEAQAEEMRVVARKALNQHRQVLSNIPEELRGSGTNRYMNMIFGELGFSIGTSREMFAGGSSSIFNGLKEQLLENDGMVNRNYHRIFLDKEHITRTIEDKNVVKNLIHKRSDITRRLVTKMPNTNGGSSLAIKAAGLAAGVMLAGYAGGNPSEPTGMEAEQIQSQLNGDSYTEMPQFTDPNLGLVRNGTPKGYVINLNAASNDSNVSSGYMGRIIRNAMTSTYSNSNININMNVRERKDKISNSDLNNYLLQAL